jgi:hypothetical protein
MRVATMLAIPAFLALSCGSDSSGGGGQSAVMIGSAMAAQAILADMKGP